MLLRCGSSFAGARGVAWLTRLPVTQEIAGSNPVGPAKFLKHPLGVFFKFDEPFRIRNRRSRLREDERFVAQKQHLEAEK